MFCDVAPDGALRTFAPASYKDSAPTALNHFVWFVCFAAKESDQRSLFLDGLRFQFIQRAETAGGKAGFSQ